MKMNAFKVLVVTALFMLTACGGGTDVVESGTYEGIVKEVEPSKTEIYVETADGKTLELYFNDETKLTRDGEPVEFAMIQQGGKVKVEVKKVGKRLEPLSVKIIN